MDPSAHFKKPRVIAAMTSFAIAVLIGMGLALYMCTPREDSFEWSPSRAVATGLAGCVAVFILMGLITFGTILAGLRDVSAQRQRNPDSRIATPKWMGATVKLRLALVYVIYACMGFSMGGGVAAVLRALGS